MCSILISDVADFGLLFSEQLHLNGYNLCDLLIINVTRVHVNFTLGYNDDGMLIYKIDLTFQN